MFKSKKQYRETFLKRIIAILGISLLLTFTWIIFQQLDNKKEYKADTTELKKEVETITHSCSSKNQAEKARCYEKEFATLANQKGIEVAEKTLYALQEIDPFTRSCHVLAHRIAEAATRRDPSSWKKLMEQVSVSACGAGFLHGILEAHIASEPSFKITPALINEICNSGPIEKKRMCSHFLAHLLFIEKEGNVQFSLPTCKDVSEELAYECYVGIFMEDHQKNIMVDHGLVVSPIINAQYAKELADACNKHQGIISAACWAEMAEIFAKAHNYEQKNVYEGCYSAPNPDEQQRCYLKGVIILTTYPNFGSLEKLQTVCAPYEEDLTLSTKCIQFVIAGLMNYSTQFTERGITFCASVNKTYEEVCFKELGTQLKMHIASQTEREVLCESTPNQYKKTCISY